MQEASFFNDIILKYVIIIIFIKGSIDILPDDCRCVPTFDHLVKKVFNGVSNVLFMCSKSKDSFYLPINCAF